MQRNPLSVFECFEQLILMACAVTRSGIISALPENEMFGAEDTLKMFRALKVLVPGVQVVYGWIPDHISATYEPAMRQEDIIRQAVLAFMPENINQEAYAKLFN